MVRLHLIVEGQTEEGFVKRVLAPFLAGFNVFADARSVETKRMKRCVGGRELCNIYRGGMIDYPRAKGDIIRWMKQDKKSDAVFSTMFDLYALPDDFPGFKESENVADPFERIGFIENALMEDVVSENDDRRFIPYIQLHEFEALILSQPGALLKRFPENEDGVAGVVNECQGFASPELIDDGFETAPSKRIIKHIPQYRGSKTSSGPILCEHIGIPAIRDKCTHFSGWLEKLQELGQ